MPIDRQDLIDRWPSFTRLDPVFQALLGQLGDQAADYAAVCAAVINAFDLDTATGDRLDKIGEIVQYVRQGETDDRYRRLIQMQIQTILSSAATTAVLLEIVRIWTETEAPSYLEPTAGLTAEVQIGATLADMSDDQPLLRFLRRAKAGGVRLLVLESEADGLILDYEPGDVVAGAGTLDYEPGDAVTGAGTLGYEVAV